MTRGRRAAVPAALMLAGVAVSGCVHGYDVSRDAMSLQRLNARLRDRPVTFTMADGRTPPAVWDVVVGPDSTHWQLECVSGPLAVSTHLVRELAVRSRARGALDGLIIGFLIGAPMGALIMDNPNGAANGVVNRLEAAAAGGVAFAVLAAPLGAILGSRLRFRLR